MVRAEAERAFTPCANTATKLIMRGLSEHLILRLVACNMAMKYHVILEFDPESGHYTGTVAGLPSIVVDAKSERETDRLAKEAIAWHLETSPHGEAHGADASTVHAKVVTVDVE